MGDLSGNFAAGYVVSSAVGGRECQPVNDVPYCGAGVGRGCAGHGRADDAGGESDAYLWAGALGTQPPQHRIYDRLFQWRRGWFSPGDDRVGALGLERCVQSGSGTDHVGRDMACDGAPRRGRSLQGISGRRSNESLVKGRLGASYRLPSFGTLKIQSADTVRMKPAKIRTTMEIRIPIARTSIEF